MDFILGFFLFFSYLVGLLFCCLEGSDRQIGWFATLIICIFCTPLIGYLAIIASPRKEDIKYQDAMNKIVFEILNQVKNKEHN